MPDLGGISGPFRITTVIDSAHGGFFAFNAGTAGSAVSYTGANTAVFRSTTKFVCWAKNSTGRTFAANTFFRIDATDNGTVTAHFDGAPGGSGTADFYFLAFNGGTRYLLT